MSIRRSFRSPLRRSALEAFVRAKYGAGFLQVGPAVSSVSSATQAEGTSLVHTVTLASAVSGTNGKYAFNIGNGTATAGSDYSATPTFSNSVTLASDILTVPIGVSSFTITVSTTDDAVYEGSETFNVTVGNQTNTGTITDNESAPTVTSVSSASATEGTDIVHTVTITGTAQAARTYAISLADVSATGGGTDYTSTLTSGAFSNGVTISGGTITVPAGVTSFTVSVPTSSDALVEGSETYTLSIGGASGTGTIIDEDAPAVAFSLVLSNPVGATISDGTGTATVTGGGGGGAFSGSPAFARTSGTAPLYVNLDMTAIVSSLSSNSNHDCLYVVDWGDSGAGTWENGVQSSGVNNRNVSYGPWAGHVYETGGSKTVSITVYDGTNVYSTTQVISVTSADAAYPTTSTVCISHSGNFTGIPSGASTVTAGSTDLYAAYQANKGANKRLMFCKADAWTCTAPLEITQANVTLDGYGTGSAFSFGSGTAVSVTTSELGNAVFIARTAGTDAKVWGFKLTCAANTSAFSADETIDRVLVGRVEKQGGAYGFRGNPGAAGASVMEGLHLYKCLADNPYAWGISGRMSVYAGFIRGGMSGCYFDNQKDLEQTTRHPLIQNAHIDHNTLKRPNVGKNTLKIHSVEYALAALYSEKFMVRGNVLDCRGGYEYNGTTVPDTEDCSMVIGNGGSSENERCRNGIVESNIVHSHNGQTRGATFGAINCPNMTVRNNILSAVFGDGVTQFNQLNLSGGVVFAHISTSTPEPSSNIRVYNNTVYSNCNDAAASMVWMHSADSNNIAVKNNIAYFPYIDWWKDKHVYNVVGAVVSASNNTTNANTNPNFVALPPVALTDWRPNTGSYAIDTGTAVPVLRDFNYATRTGTYDLGAVIP